MLYVPDAATTSDNRDLLKSRMRRYAVRYYITGPEREALVAQKIIALVKEPEALFGHCHSAGSGIAICQ
ncbi:hypothetical protein KX729_22450 [Rhizobium sp. XQZ8]|uniref:hypothetical protein n=1 Tax=Rhizobium populisoli TaxID=2859785 RepID=UPI001CA4C8CA|nr:hypothetical protein [Rhizobium populisoli]MBW6424224.1 hypothetical protein [Rhizobium populisoli]